MREYEAVEMELINISHTDVIVASGEGSGGDNELPAIPAN